jgi:hypothetical protein
VQADQAWMKSVEGSSDQGFCEPNGNEQECITPDNRIYKLQPSNLHSLKRFVEDAEIGGNGIIVKDKKGAENRGTNKRDAVEN